MGRNDTLKWMLKMLDAEPDVRRDIRVALVRGLGSVLRRTQGSGASADCIEIDSSDELLLVQAFELTDSLAAAEAIADLKVYSRGLADWLFSSLKSHVIVEGKWPFRHIAHLCDQVCLTSDSDRAQQLGKLVLGRLHASAFNEQERCDILEILSKLQALGVSLPVQEFLESGDVNQRLRVLEAAAELGAGVGMDCDNLNEHLLDARAATSELRMRALQAMEALGMQSGLMDWLLSKPELITEGGWGMNEVMWICDLMCSSADKERAEQLGRLVLGRLHAPALKEEERSRVIEVLSKLQALVLQLPVHEVLETGDIKQRLRVLEAAAEVDILIEGQSVGKLAKCLLEDIKVIPENAFGSDKNERMCTNFMSGHCRFGAGCHFAHRKENVKMCNGWIKGTCTFGKRCWYRHGTIESLLTHILEGCGGPNEKVNTYLVKILRPAAGDKAVTEVLSRLQPKVQDKQPQRTADDEEAQGREKQAAKTLVALVQSSPDGQLSAAELCSRLYQKFPEAKDIVHKYKGIKSFIAKSKLSVEVEFVADQVWSYGGRLARSGTECSHQRVVQAFLARRSEAPALPPSRFVRAHLLD